MTNLLWIITIFLVFSAVNHIHHIIYRYTSLCNICGYYNLVQVDMEKKIDTSIVSNMTNIPNREPTDVKLNLQTELTIQLTTKIKSNCITWFDNFAKLLASLHDMPSLSCIIKLFWELWVWAIAFFWLLLCIRQFEAVHFFYLINLFFLVNSEINNGENSTLDCQSATVHPTKESSAPLDVCVCFF